MNLRLVLPWLCLAIAGCVQDEGTGEPGPASPAGGGGSGGGGTPAVSTPVNDCGADPVARPPTTGRYSGFFGFEGDQTGDFPLSLDLDVGSLRATGTVQFTDGQRSYEGPVDATLSADGRITGSFSGTSTDRTVDGTFEGVIDASKGCGTWDNTAGQSGPWTVTR